MTDLDSLVARVEAADGSDRELDAAIFHAIGAPVPFQFANKLIALEFNDVENAYFARVSDDMQVRYSPPHYTASLDAAMTLVPSDEFWEWQLEAEETEMFFPVPSPVTYRCKMGHLIEVEAATPALALAAACLKARSASQ